jgi:DNA-binding beta-propeller fold protein YncE
LPEIAGAVGGGDFHSRAAFDPDGGRVYVTTLVAIHEQYAIHLRTYRYDPFTCSMGPSLGRLATEGDTASNTRVYGLEVHPDGRSLYQTTASAQTIRRFQLGDDRFPVPAERYDVTQGGTVLCEQSRRLTWHPSGHTLYSNCNNGDAGPEGLQVWAVAPNGTLRFVEHHTLQNMDAGITDPVLHPSGRWLYQPVGTTDPAAPQGPGAYIVVFAIAPNGTLHFHAATPVRVRHGQESVQDMSQMLVFPITVSIHPDGTHAYVALNATIPDDTRDSPHEIISYTLAEGGGRLVEVERRPAALPTRSSSHHGGALVQAEGGLFYYSYLTDYDETRGGVLQLYRVGGDHMLRPLDPPFVGTRLLDARQPIVAPSARPPL